MSIPTWLNLNSDLDLNLCSGTILRSWELFEIRPIQHFCYKNHRSVGWLGKQLVVAYDRIEIYPVEWCQTREDKLRDHLSNVVEHAYSVSFRFLDLFRKWSLLVFYVFGVLWKSLGFLSCRRFWEPHSWAKVVESMKHGAFGANYNDTKSNVLKNGWLLQLSLFRTLERHQVCHFLLNCSTCWLHFSLFSIFSSCLCHQIKHNFF